MSAHLAWWVVLLLVAAGCGTNRPERPDDLGSVTDCAAGYPAGPYGTEPGDVLKNACFQGWFRPDGVARTPETLEPIALGDFYDPRGTRNIRLLLVNTAALWCSACRIEHQSLPQHAEALGPAGLAVLSAIFQGVEREPASFEDLKLWVETYSSNFPTLLDPNYEFGLYASAETAPLNLIVDPRTMKILKKYIGDQSAVIWPYIEAELARRR